MFKYRSPELDSLLRYFQGKYPILKDTKAIFTQELGKDEKGRIKTGVYSVEEDAIILLDNPAFDYNFYNIFAHEASHAINWKSNKVKGHGKKWTRICNDIYAKTGILPIRAEGDKEDVSNNSSYDMGIAAYARNQGGPSEVLSTTIDPKDDDTLIYIKRHKARIKFWMLNFSNFLIERAVHHDDTKLKDPEISMWRNMDKEPRHQYSEDPKSPYQQKLKKYFPVFEEHWKHNRHHLEYYRYNTEDFGLDLIDLVELICDQLLGYKYEVGYDKAMKECRRLEGKYPEIFGEKGIRVIELMENTIRNYFVTFADQKPVACKFENLGSGISIDILV